MKYVEDGKTGFTTPGFAKRCRTRLLSRALDILSDPGPARVHFAIGLVSAHCDTARLHECRSTLCHQRGIPKGAVLDILPVLTPARPLNLFFRGLRLTVCGVEFAHHVRERRILLFVNLRHESVLVHALIGVRPLPLHP